MHVRKIIRNYTCLRKFSIYKIEPPWIFTVIFCISFTVTSQLPPSKQHPSHLAAVFSQDLFRSTLHPSFRAVPDEKVASLSEKQSRAAGSGNVHDRGGKKLQACRWSSVFTFWYWFTSSNVRSLVQGCRRRDVFIPGS